MKTKTNNIIASLLLAVMLVSSASVVQAAHEGTKGYMTVDRAVYEKLLSDIALTLENYSQILTEKSGSMMTPSTETGAADVRVALNSLMKEHVNLGLIALYNVIDNSPATGASVAALDENSVDLAAVVGSVYGADAEAAFLQIWRDHIGFFANYATGLRTDDAVLRTEAEEDLEDYQQEVAVFFNGALPNIPVSGVIAGAGEHKDLLIEAMDEYHAGDYEAAYAAQRKADKQIAGIANLLAKEIVAQNPESF